MLLALFIEQPLIHVKANPILMATFVDVESIGIGIVEIFAHPPSLATCVPRASTLSHQWQDLS